MNPLEKYPKPTQTFQSYTVRPIVTTTGSWRMMALIRQPHVPKRDLKMLNLYVYILLIKIQSETNEWLCQSKPGGIWQWSSAGGWIQVGSHQDCSVINSTKSSCLPQPKTKSPSLLWLNHSLSLGQPQYITWLYLLSYLRVFTQGRVATDKVKENNLEMIDWNEHIKLEIFEFKKNPWGCPKTLVIRLLINWQKKVWFKKSDKLISWYPTTLTFRIHMFLWTTREWEAHWDKFHWIPIWVDPKSEPGAILETSRAFKQVRPWHIFWTVLIP